ncbi:MAG: hypothetical protein JXB48_15705 [Candidatus Latescibacteria bacterium]|nr:hypothetical protein [Candidatus Latescibacterota bacterium]
MNTRIINRSVLFSIILLAVLTAGCRMHSVESTWRDREVTIDGLDGGEEWQNARYSFDKQNVSVGLLNDETDLYIRLAIRDRNLQKQLMTAGLTVWFDAKGGDKKSIGIQFPLRMQDGGMFGGNMRSGGMSEGGRQGGDRPEGGIDRKPSGEQGDGSNEQDRSNMMLEAIQREIKILGPGKNESKTVSKTDAQKMGIDCRIDNPKGNMVYELKIPLIRTESKPYGIGTELPKTVGIGLETGKINMSKMQGRKDEQRGRMGGSGSGMGGMGGGRGGMGGGPGGGMGGGRGGMGGGRSNLMTEPLELWMKTKLATK